LRLLMLYNTTMSRNGYTNPQTGPMILVLYKIVNSESDGVDDLYNCFQMPYGNGITLNSIKHNCVAAHSLSHLGPEGYHYRVMVEDKTGTDRSFSWWDIQDGNAKLPVKETSQYELRKLLFPSSKSSSGSSTISSENATKAAKGAFKMMGKAMASAIGDEGGVENHGPPVSVIVVKMLDLVKIHNEHDQKHGGGGGHAPTTPKQQRPRRVAPPQKSRHPAPTPARTNANSRPTPSRPQPTARRAQPAAPAGGGGNLMDFGDAPSSSKVLHHSSSMPNHINPNETRAQRLKRQNEQKLKTSNRFGTTLINGGLKWTPRRAIVIQVLPEDPVLPRICQRRRKWLSSWTCPTRRERAPRSNGPCKIVSTK